MRTLSAIVLAALVSCASTARAELTPAERSRLDELYAKGELAQAAQLRAVLARPDLSPAEAGAAFSEVASHTRFDERHETMLAEALFGPASAGSRNVVAQAVVAGLLARASAVLASGDASRGDEALRLHAFVEQRVVATALGSGPGAQASGGIYDDGRRALLDLYRRHLASPAVASAALRDDARGAITQAQIVAADLAAGLAPRTEVAGWFGGGAVEQSMFAHHGVLLVGVGEAPPESITSLQTLLDATLPALADTRVVWLGKPWPTRVRARGAVVASPATLGARRAMSGLWPTFVRGAPDDAATAELAFALARALISRRIAEDPRYREHAVGASVRAQKAGAGGPCAPMLAQAWLDGDAPEVDGPDTTLLAWAGAQLLLDAPRAVGAALRRAVADQRPEPMEQLALALGALAVDPAGHLVDHAAVGRADATGAIRPLPITGIDGTSALIVRFTVDGHEVALARRADGSVSSSYLDGKPPAPDANPLGGS